MAQIKKTLSVERAIGGEESKKDIEVITEISKKLQSASSVKIYKKDEFNKAYLDSIPAEEFMKFDPHEFIKKKYGKKTGGGEYLIEILDSDANVVKEGIISIAKDESEEKKTETKEGKIVEEALKMREEAFEKVKEAAQEKSKAEKTKYELTIDNMSMQWDTIKSMYQSQIDLLMEQVKASKDPNTQTILQMNLDRIKSEFENSKREFELKMQTIQEGQGVTGKIFELVGTLIPLIVNKSSEKGKDPVEELSKTIGLISSITGGRKDLIESLIENPEKMVMFQRLLGLSTNEKKDMFSDILENPMKADIFKKVLGIEEKKDFIMELMENPIKFEMFKKFMGIDKQDELIDEIKKMGEKSVVPIEAPKDFVDEIIEAKTKFESLKSIFSPSQPAKTFIELISTLLSNIGPQIVQGIQQVTNSMVTVEMIKKGMLTQLPDGRLIPKSTVTEHPKVKETVPEPLSGVETKKEETVPEENIERLFETIIIDVASSHQKEELPAEIFVDKIAELVVKKFNERPSLALQLIKHKDIAGSMGLIFTKVLPALNEEQIKQIAQLTIDKVLEKIKG